ncbi:MAG TPA: hypothetical protein VKY65_21995 [Alphaproteobacteria bacterium]|nr:hypothetical protein [Alphaproteobacteria bacterium]
MAMDTRMPQQARRRLHPAVYKAIVVCMIWMILATLGFLGKSQGAPSFWYEIVAGFAAMTVLLPLNLWRLWRRDHMDEAMPATTARNWLEGEFQTWQERLSAKAAIINILIPPLAAAVAMTLLVIICNIDKA